MGVNLLIERTIDLESRIFELLDLKSYDNTARITTSKTLCIIGFDHAAAIRILFSKSLNSPAVSLARVQFEVLVRALWVLYSATDSEVEKMAAELSSENESKAGNLSNLSAMIKKLEGKAPPQVVEMLTGFKGNSWKALNSYVHGGIHAVRRAEAGFPPQLVEQIIRNTNAVSIMNAMLLGVLTGDESVVQEVRRIQIEYADCLPELVQKTT